MASSEEYLAGLGFDTSDADKAIEQTITLLGHLGNQFDNVSKGTERAERALAKVGSQSRATAAATDQNAKAEQERNKQLEIASKQTAIYNQYLYDQERGLQRANGNLARLRYAVYDVSNALGVGGAAAVAFTAGIVGVGVQYEREFAEVRRTVGVTGDDARQLYQDFLQLSREIPVSFSSLSEIGGLAGQLGIMESRVESFTETVAQFSATTDVTVNASATAFGRLDALIDGVDGRYKNLGSSILSVGINSVATESQIINIASQIAATGNQAGLTADEIIGLSGALASMGVAPEAARGTILRVFSQINSAIAQGGERLNDFATISGMSAAEFRDGWSSDFTTTFVEFLRGIGANGDGAERALRGLGITAARDVNALLKLSQNADDVQQYLGLAADGFNNAGLLADNFGVIAETNASRLQTLQNTLMALMATLGQASSGPLSGFLDYLQRVLAALTDFSSTPFGQGIALFSAVLGGTLAVMLLVSAAALRGAGTFLALKTAIGETYLQTMLAQGGLRGFTAQLFGAAGGATALSAAIKATGVGLLITGGMYLLGEAVSYVGNQMRSGKDQAEKYFGSLDGLSDAIKADNVAAFAQGLGDANAAIGESQSAGGSWIDTLIQAAEAQQQLQARTTEAGGAIDQQTLNIGTNTQEWLRNALASSEAFQSVFANLDQLRAITGDNQFSAGGIDVTYQAFDLEKYIDIAATQGSEASAAFLDNWIMGLEQGFAAEGGGNPVALVGEALGGADTLTKIYDAGEQIGNAVTEGMNQAASANAQNALLDAVLGPLQDGADEASDTFRSLMDDVYGVINAEAELSDATFRLGEDFATNGAAVASSGGAMQAVIQAIYESSSGAGDAAARMQGLFDALVSGGYASAAQLSTLQAVINNLAGGKAVRAATFDLTQFAGGIQKVQTAAAKRVGGGGGRGRRGGGGGGAAETIRTLVDYANDLRQVLSRSFDIRFGGMQAADSIASSWNRLREAVAQTNEEIRRYQADMQELNADRSVREYWLRVAENYRDALRAGQLRAEIADIDEKLAKNASGLTEAQQKNSRSLEGNSDAAIDNRKTILDLVGGYQQYIASLAAAGVPQEQLQAEAARLKEEFIQQATQLGFNRDELGKYAAQFDSVTAAIGRVPRNITVAANIDPAIQALNELEARARRSGAAAGAGYADAFGGAATPSVNLNVGAAQGAALGGLFGTAFAAQAKTSIVDHLNTIRSGALAGGVIGSNAGLKFYRSGTAWTGSGHPGEVAGIVHNRERVLNETGSRMVSAQFVAAANQGRSPWQYAPQAASAQMPSRLVVELSPVDRELIATKQPVILTLGADGIARAAAAVAEDDSRRGGG